jgi:hypothetical protein
VGVWGYELIINGYYVINVTALSQAVYTLSGKVKYPSDERLMQVCYDALSDAGNDDFNTIKRGGWKRYFNKNIRPLVSKNYNKFKILL